VDVPAARRIERPAWLNVRTVLGLVLFAVALFGGQRVLAGAAQTVPVWTAARDIGPGEELTFQDVRVADVRLPADLLAGYVAGDESVEGLVTTRAFGRGELIAARWIADTDAFPGAAMTVPVTPEHAVGGTLRPGDIVDVYATFNAADLRARTELVVGGAEVLDIVDAGGLVVADETMIGVTLAVDPQAAGTLANAIRTAEVDLVRVTGT
jgi:Flp pilus assembly protein CpaB